jgi:hypothetical protein
MQKLKSLLALKDINIQNNYVILNIIADFIELISKSNISADKIVTLGVRDKQILNTSVIWNLKYDSLIRNNVLHSPQSRLNKSHYDGTLNKKGAFIIKNDNNRKIEIDDIFVKPDVKMKLDIATDPTVIIDSTITCGKEVMPKEKETQDIGTDTILTFDEIMFEHKKEVDRLGKIIKVENDKYTKLLNVGTKIQINKETQTEDLKSNDDFRSLFLNLQTQIERTKPEVITIMEKHTEIDFIFDIPQMGYITTLTRFVKYLDSLITIKKTKIVHYDEDSETDADPDDGEEDLHEMD